MSDNKYGRMFTISDVEEIVRWATQDPEYDLSSLLDTLDLEEVRFKFPVDEPTFTLRARDRRALAALRYYRDHQSPGAPVNHLDGLDAAYRSFDDFATNHRELMKEPD